jgi:hypothetical protein
MLFMRSKLTHIPPLVDVKAPPKLVPPENEVTAIWRSLHAFKMLDVVSADLGNQTLDALLRSVEVIQHRMIRR